MGWEEEFTIVQHPQGFGEEGGVCFFKHQAQGCGQLGGSGGPSFLNFGVRRRRGRLFHGQTPQAFGEGVGGQRFFGVVGGRVYGVPHVEVGVYFGGEGVAGRAEGKDGEEVDGWREVGAEAVTESVDPTAHTLVEQIGFVLLFHLFVDRFIDGGAARLAITTTQEKG